MAQQLKQFTLEDLNFGGTNYRQMTPANMYLTWWGDRLMYQDAEEWGTVDMRTGEKKAVGTLDKVNEALASLDGGTTESKMRSAMGVVFPYPDSTMVLLRNTKERILYDWQSGRVVWRRVRARPTVTGTPVRAPLRSSGTTSSASPVPMERPCS